MIERIETGIAPSFSPINDAVKAGKHVWLVAIAEASLAQAGATRICALGEMAWPPPTWHHDGQPPLGVLVRRCDVEG